MQTEKTNLLVPPANTGWLTLTQAAQLLGVRPTTLLRWADEREIRCLRTPGGHRRFFEEDLHAFSHAREQPDPLPAPGTSTQYLTRQTRQEVVASVAGEPWHAAFDEAGRAARRESGYPILLVHLDRARCLVVGGGAIAARKVAGLRTAGAKVTVISPTLCQPLEDLAAHSDIEVIRRAYHPGDLAGAFLVIAATDVVAVNQQVWEEAQYRGVLVNVVDDPTRCNFIAPAVVRRGPLTVAISTSGHCPALARHLRERLEQEFGPPYGPFVEILGELRERALTALPLTRRNAFWNQLFHSDVLALLASGDEVAARHRAEEILDQNVSRGAECTSS